MGKLIRYDHEGNQIDVDVEPQDRIERSVGFAAEEELVELYLPNSSADDEDVEDASLEWSVEELKRKMYEATALLQSLRDAFEGVSDDMEQERDAMVDVMHTYDGFLGKLGLWTGEH